MKINHTVTVTIASLAVVVAAVAGCATSVIETEPNVPASLRAPSDQKLLLKAKAVGVQIYVCAPNKTDATRSEWSFKAPEAELFDNSGKKIGKHYAGPTWESTDGSKVVGEPKARDDGPDGGAIPWLLLAAKSVAGNGVLSQVKSIQRVDTVAGKAPAEPCDTAQLGKESRVPYTAAYYFYGAK